MMSEHPWLKAFLTLSELHAPGYRAHAVRLARAVRLLAQALDFAPQRLQRATEAAVLHGIGRIALPPEICVREHCTSESHSELPFAGIPEKSAEIVKQIPNCEDLAQIIRQQAECYDGSGPLGLAGDGILLESRMLAIAAGFDLCHFGPDAAAGATLEDTVFRLKNASGSLFDPTLFELFWSANIPKQVEKNSTAVHILVSELTEGMTFSQPLQDRSGNELYPNHTVLTQELIAELVEFQRAEAIWPLVEIDCASLELLRSPFEFTPQSSWGSAPEELDERRSTIVVVDDEPGIINALRRELRIAGFHVEGFQHPLDAVQFVREHPETKAALVDYCLVGLTGDKLIQLIKEDRPDLPCMILTAHATQKVILSIHNTVKVERIFRKPWNGDEIVSVLNKQIKPPAP